MKAYNRIFAFMLLLVMLTSMVCAAAHAEVPDLSKIGSITITLTYSGKAVSGGTLIMYHVADAVRDDIDYYFEFTKSFSGCKASLTELDALDNITVIEKYITNNRPKGQTFKVDTNGTIKAENLTPGLYFFKQGTAATGYKAISSFLVTVPFRQGETLVYDVDASPKVAVEPAPTPPPYIPTVTPTPDVTPPPIPQTGQLWWPVPVMAGVGLVLVALGWARHRKSDEDEET